jgi:ribosomal protein S18 acetylase RimI-like enzyme
MTAGKYTIRKTVRDDLAVFFPYLNDHLSDNGSDGTALFMPLPRSESRFSIEKEAAFRLGMETPVGQPGWRRGWLALAPDGSIAGHIDLRSRPEKMSAHRALLGMGVHRDFRQQGLGAAMLEVATAWAREQELDWIDLEMLSGNGPARQLYLRAGFCVVGEMADTFRIDGVSLGYTFMSKRIRA